MVRRKKNSLRLRHIRWKKRGTFRKNCGRWNRAGSNGEEVFLGQTEDGRLHAAYETGGQIYYIIEENGDRDFLIEYLKNNL